MWDPVGPALRSPIRSSNAAHTDTGQAALNTTVTGLSASSGRGGCFIKIGIIAPSALKVAP